MPAGHIARTLMLTAFVLSTTAGCSDTTFDPFDNDQKYYTVYGFLDQLEVNHKLRVIEVTRQPEHILSDTEDNRIDARVFTTDMTTGTVTEWNHALEQLDDGTYGHVFRARFLLTQGRSYRLEVVRSDGKMAWAETRVPYIGDLELFERGPVQFSADSLEAWQDIVIPRVSSPWEITALYLLNNENDGQLPGGGALQATFPVSYGRVGERTADGGWRMRLDLTGDTRTVRAIVADYRARGVYDQSKETVVSMGVQVRILDVAWDPPRGVFDPEVLAQPGVMTNINHGHGLFGSIGLYRQEWPVDSELARAIGYER